VTDRFVAGKGGAVNRRKTKAGTSTFIRADAGALTLVGWTGMLAAETRQGLKKFVASVAIFNCL